MAWADRAACRGLTDIMFPRRGDAEGFTRARRICESCPVIDECLAYVTENPQRYGVWAGIAGKEITEERKRLNVTRPIAAHGTRAKYARGCRCEDCTEANTSYKRSRRLNVVGL